MRKKTSRHQVEYLNEIGLVYEIHKEWNVKNQNYYKLLNETNDLFINNLFSSLEPECAQKELRYALIAQKRICEEAKFNMGSVSIVCFVAVITSITTILSGIINKLEGIWALVVLISVSLCLVYGIFDIAKAWNSTKNGFYIQFIDDCINIINNIEVKVIDDSNIKIIDKNNLRLKSLSVEILR